MASILSCLPGQVSTCGLFGVVALLRPFLDWANLVPAKSSPPLFQAWLFSTSRRLENARRAGSGTTVWPFHMYRVSLAEIFSSGPRVPTQQKSDLPLLLLFTLVSCDAVLSFGSPSPEMIFLRPYLH